MSGAPLFSRALLGADPASFREEYGLEMSAVFRPVDTATFAAAC
jgi:hypothetical protein